MMMRHIFQEEQAPCPDMTFGELLKKEKLTVNLTHFVLHSIAMVEAGVSAGDGLRATKKFLSSLGRYLACRNLGSN